MFFENNIILVYFFADSDGVLVGGGLFFLHMSFYIHTHDRLDKLYSALAEVRLKT